MAEEGIRALARGAPRAVADPGDPTGRADTLYGAYLAGAAFAVAGSALHHKIAHVLGGAYDLPHADLHTVLLPQVVAFLEPELPDAMARVAAALGSEGSAARALYELAEGLDAPLALADIGLDAGDLPEAAELVLAGVASVTPRPSDLATVRELLDNAYAGMRPGTARIEGSRA
jgi:alcohol dehydrogenase class IV